MTSTLIKEAYVIDPATGIEGIRDILIENNKIKKVNKNIKINDDTDIQVYNGKGLIACPGLIDTHVHCYEYATKLGSETDTSTSSSLQNDDNTLSVVTGINVDEHCLMNGTTTVIDAGSAGEANFMGLKKFIIEKSNTRVKAFLHIANHGLTSATCAGIEKGGECDSLNQVNTAQCISRINQFPNDIVGIKVRLSESVCSDGKNELEVYKRALEASKATGKPLMTHHAFSSIGTGDIHKDRPGCPGNLRSGDIYTHMYHSYINDNGKIDADFLNARKRGVIFDVGHGMGGFSWKNAEVCAKYNFWPDTISTDLHTFSCFDGLACNLPTVMTKLLKLGMPLLKIIEAVTWTPAKIMQMTHDIGSLEEGKEADITLLEIRDVTFNMRDCHEDTRLLHKSIIAITVWKAGVKYDCKKN